MSRLLSLTVLLTLTGCSEYDISSNPPTEVVGPEGSIQGQICDIGGDAWLADAYVYVQVDTDGDGEPDLHFDTTTDADGNYVLEDIPYGEHVLIVEKGRFYTEIQVTLDDETFVFETPECIEQHDVKLAVVTGAYDSVEVILDAMGLDFDLYEGADYSATEYLDDLLYKPSKLNEYDIIFLNCGINDEWQYGADVTENLRNYVRDGGSVYTSDWAYNPGSAYVGASGDVSGTVKDKPLKTALGSKHAELIYDLPGWAVVESVGAGTEVLVTGTAVVEDYYSYEFTELHESPLVIRVEKGEGTALYTTFHNEQQLSFDMAVLLEELVYSL